MAPLSRSMIAMLASVAVSLAVPVNQDDLNSCLLSKVMIGGDNLMLQLDTRSTDFWVYSDFTNVTDEKVHRNVYHATTGNPIAGSHFATDAKDHRWHAPRAEGELYRDRISVGRSTVQDGKIGVATSANSSGVICAMDSIFGLAWAGHQKINKHIAPSADNRTSLETLMANHEQKAIAIYYGEGNNASLSLGPAKHKMYHGRLHHYNVVDNSGLWKIPVKAGDTKHNHHRVDAIIDTGNDFLFLPPKFVANYYKRDHIRSVETYDGQYVVDCNQAMPRLKLRLGPHHHGHGTHQDKAETFHIPGSAMKGKRIPEMPSKCLGALQTANGENILGNVFLRNVYTVFDLNHDIPRVGFGKKK